MKFFQQLITTGRFTLPIATFFAIICWIVVYIFIPELPPQETSYSIWQKVAPELPRWGERLLGLLCTLVIGYFLIYLNNTYLLIRRRASVQTSIYLLFISACPLLHASYPAGIAAFMLLLAMHNLFKCYQYQHTVGYVLNSFVFLGLGSLIIPQYTFFALVFLIGVSSICGLGIKNFLAAILGWSIPYLFLVTYAYYTNQMHLFCQPFIELTTFQSFNIENLYNRQWVTPLYFFIVFLVTGINTLVNKNKDKLSTRVYLRFIILLIFSIFIYIFLQPMHAIGLFTFLLAGISIVAAHFFVLTNGKASNLFFIGVVIGLILLFGFNIVWKG